MVHTNRPTETLGASREARAALPEWFLIHSNPCREQNAQSRLEAEGVRCYLPLVATRRAGGRGDRCALFPSYLFANFISQETSVINSILALRHGTVGIGRVVF